MAGRIQGITVQLGADTTKLSSALQNVNKDIKNTQSQLKDVEKLLKLDPSNTELLSQKQKLLADAIKETKEKLTTLKTAAEQANEQLQKGEITQEQYDALQREIQETEQALKQLEAQAATTNTTLAKIEEVGGKFEEVGGKMTSAGKNLTTKVTAPILKRRNPDCKIFCLTIPSNNATQNPYSDAVRYVAEMHFTTEDNVYLVDLGKDYLERYTGSTPIAKDKAKIKSHASAVGYRLMASLLEEAISRRMLENQEDFVNVAYIPYDAGEPTANTMTI